MCDLAANVGRSESSVEADQSDMGRRRVQFENLEFILQFKNMR